MPRYCVSSFRGYGYGKRLLDDGVRILAFERKGTSVFVVHTPSGPHMGPLPIRRTTSSKRYEKTNSKRKKLRLLFIASSVWYVDIKARCYFCRSSVHNKRKMLSYAWLCINFVPLLRVRIYLYCSLSGRIIRGMSMINDIQCLLMNVILAYPKALEWLHRYIKCWTSGMFNNLVVTSEMYNNFSTHRWLNQSLLFKQKIIILCKIHEFSVTFYANFILVLFIVVISYSFYYIYFFIISWMRK